MSTHLQSDTSSVAAKREFTKIDKFFNTAEHFVRRSGSFLSVCKTEIAPLFVFIQARHLSPEKIELYMYRSIILSITAVHLIEFLWHSIRRLFID